MFTFFPLLREFDRRKYLTKLAQIPLIALSRCRTKMFASVSFSTTNSSHAFALNRCSRRHHRSATKTPIIISAEMEVPEVKGLSKDPCDAFECKGTSPAVESSLRQLARDLRDGKDSNRSIFPYAKDVRFSDGARRFSGSEKFKSCNCELNSIFGGEKISSSDNSKTNNNDNIRNRKFTNWVDSIEVLPGGSVAKILWRIESKDGKAKVKVETTLEMNLITGKVLSQDDQWTFLKGGEIIESKRKALAVPDKVGNAMDEIMRTVDDATRAARELVNSKNGGEDDFAVDPNDPMKFFSYENNQNRNLSEFALLLALLFLISKLYEQVALLK